MVLFYCQKSMQVKDLRLEGDFYQCPNCGEWDMKELKIWGEDESIDTGNYVCGSCGVDYQENDYGVLVGAPDYLHLSMMIAKEEVEQEESIRYCEKIAEQESKWGEERGAPARI